MNATSAAADLLRQLPPTLRRTLYAVVVLLGAVLAALDAAGVSDLGPITVAQALQVYAYISPLVGIVAVANVHPAQPTDAADPAAGYEHEEDVDLSSFEPVSDPADVYGQPA